MLGFQKSKNSLTYLQVIDWTSKNRIKSSVFAFLFAFLILGGGYWTFDKLVNKPEPVFDLFTGEVQQGEYGIIPAWWMDDYFGESACSYDTCKYNSDPDQDKLTNGQEYYYRSDPNKADTNGNGLNDGEDVAQGFDPSKPGKMTFDEAGSDESILGEGLVFGNDIKDLVAEEKDLDRVGLPIVPDARLKIITDDSDAAIKKYLQDVTAKVEQYFPAKDFAQIKEVLEKGSGDELKRKAANSSILSIELTKISVPPKLLNFHRYNITLYQLLADLMYMESIGIDLNSTQGDVWYDKAQGLFAVTQRLQLEKDKLTIYN